MRPEGRSASAGLFTTLPIEARILAVADVVEAIIFYRPCRPAPGIDIALAEIENHAGTLYDVKAMSACLTLFREKNFKI